MNITLGITDDHQLFLKSLSLLISSLEDFTIVVEAMNGKDLIEKLDSVLTMEREQKKGNENQQASFGFFL